MRSLLATCVALSALTVGCTVVQSNPGTPGYVSSGSAAMEINVDRPGSDYRSFDLAAPRPETCRDTCMVEPQCVAFTYVNPGVQGPAARCWLKNAIPAATPNACCTSGIKNAPPSQRNTEVVPTAPRASTPPPPVAPQTSNWRGVPPERTYPGDGASLEANIDRNGSDFANFDLAQPRPALCQEACMADVRCRAFTYVNPGVQGPSARCWLKNAVPNATANACCTSGVKAGYSASSGAPPMGSSTVFDLNMDRPGSDFTNFDMTQPRPELCREACQRDNRCRAFTYVNPGVQGPGARCWLKSSVPPATPNNCCMSGVK